VGLTFLAARSTASPSTPGTDSGSGSKPASSSSPTATFQGLEFNVGVIYQKVNELGPGLAVGQTVASTQALKTTTALKAGLYIGIGVKLM
jgi:hypothetical protein